MIRTVALIALLATPVAAADFEFCWEGANGYRMEGTMRIDDALLNRSILTEDDIGTFFIQGFKDDIALGAWDMSQMTPTTSWNLSFDPRGMVFPTGGMHDSDKGQAWNAGGRRNQSFAHLRRDYRVLSDECELVSARTMKPPVMPHRVDATQQERRFG